MAILTVVCLFFFAGVMWIADVVGQHLWVVLLVASGGWLALVRAEAPAMMKQSQNRFEGSA